MSATPGMIRNIQQSVQNRDVTKQAPDIVVYIDGRDYLLNPYLNDSQGRIGVTVPVNDYVSSWQSSYDVDAMIPSGSLTLMVPVQDEHLFRMPGGNKVLRTMSEIRVFAKGYFLSPRGNTMYHQIFKGFISSISYTPSGKMTSITLACRGALGLLEKMQVDQNPSSTSSAPLEQRPYTSTSWNLDPYQMIAWVFLYASMIDGFEMYAIPQAAMNKDNPYYEAVKEQYVSKWQALLYDLARDVHVFGVPNVVDVIQKIHESIKKEDGNDYGMQALGVLWDTKGTKNEKDLRSEQEDFYGQLRNYMPDMGIGSIQLINGRVTSRLERLRYITNLVGFEAYQDVDGAVIVKPPLYNLDVLNLDPTTPKTVDSPVDDLTDQNNPFVVQLSEILPGDTEVEDESAVRMTRVTAQGGWDTAFQWSGGKELKATAEDIDVEKLSQFGLRTEPPHEAHWFQEANGEALYAFAASEMARANRGLRQYSLTIPIRPELRIGFPMYLPHLDIYGYIKTITMSYTKGSDATTSIVLDSLRRRPLFPETQPVYKDGQVFLQNGIMVTKQFMTPQPDLVTRWTKQGPSSPKNVKGVDPELADSLASLPYPQQLIIEEGMSVVAAREQGANNFGINTDSATHNWRIQPDEQKVFTDERKVDQSYYHDLHSVRPYTDGKGYELIGPFPWGRFRSLNEALQTFTVSNSLGSVTNGSVNRALAPIVNDTEILKNADAFLFTGDSPTTDAATVVVKAVAKQAAVITNLKVFELVYDDSTQPNPMDSTLGASAPAASSTSADDVAKTRSDTMLSGVETIPSHLESILKSVPVPTLPPTPVKVPVQGQVAPQTVEPFRGFGGGNSGGSGATGDW